METRQFKVAEGSNAGWRIVRRLAVVMLLTTAYVFVMQSNAFASGGLSSVVLSDSEPGLAAVPLPSVSTLSETVCLDKSMS
jgi:hypothetical protein